MKYIYIRGVGPSGKEGFSEEVEDAIRNSSDIDTFFHDTHVEFLYQDIIEEKVDPYFEAVFKKPRWYRPFKLKTWALRQFVFNYAVDATAYRNFQGRILKRLLTEVGHNTEVTFIVHSLGCMIAYDFIKKYQHVKVKNLITMGCNIPMFKLGSPEPVQIDVPWLNIWEPNDIISMPMKPLALCDVNDVEVNDRSVKGSTVAAHAIYWDNKDVRELILAELRG